MPFMEITSNAYCVCIILCWSPNFLSTSDVGLDLKAILSDVAPWLLGSMDQLLADPFMYDVALYSSLCLVDQSHKYVNASAPPLMYGWDTVFYIDHHSQEYFGVGFFSL